MGWTSGNFEFIYNVFANFFQSTNSDSNNGVKREEIKLNFDLSPDSDENIPLSNLKRTAQSQSDSDDDKPLAVLQPKLRKQKMKQQTLTDMFSKNNIKLNKTGISTSPKKRNHNPPEVIKANTLIKKLAKNPDDKPTLALYNKQTRHIAKTFSQSKIDKIQNEKLKNDIDLQLEKIRVENMTPDERKAYHNEKRRKREAEQKQRALELKNSMVDDWTLQKQPLKINTLKKLADSQLLEKCLPLPKSEMHHFSDLLVSFQFFHAHASYFAMPSFTATEVRKISFKNYLESLLNSDIENTNILKTFLFTMVRSKLAQRELNLKSLEKFDIDISNLNVKKHVTPALCCFILYSFIQQRYDEIKKHEDSKKRDRINKQAKLKKEEENRELKDLIDSEDGSRVSSVSYQKSLTGDESDMDKMSEFDEDSEHESQGYKTILNVLDANDKNFFGLGKVFCKIYYPNLTTS